MILTKTSGLVLTKSSFRIVCVFIELHVPRKVMRSAIVYNAFPQPCTVSITHP